MDKKLVCDRVVTNVRGNCSVRKTKLIGSRLMVVSRAASAAEYVRALQ